MFSRKNLEVVSILSPAREEAGEEDVHEGGHDAKVQPVEGGQDVPSLPEVEESIQESHGDVVTAAPKFPHDDVEDEVEEEPRVPEVKSLSMKRNIL